MHSSSKAIAAGTFACICAAAGAQSSVTIYGVLDVGVEYAEAGSIHRVSESPSIGTGSRLGFRGTEDLGDGLAAVFRLESGVNIDVGALAQGGLAWGREATVGLSSRTYGTVLLGRSPTPYFFNVLAVDAFQQGHAGSLLASQRSTPTANNYLLPLLAQARMDNSISYVSPAFGGSVVVRLQGSLGEGSTSIGRGYAGSARYTEGPWDATIIYVRQSGANNANGSVRAFEAGGNYNFGPAKLFFGYTKEVNDCLTCTGIYARIQGLRPGGAGDFRLTNVGVRIPVGALILIGQAARIQDRSDYAAPTGSRDALNLAVGAEYSLSKRTVLWSSVGTVGNQNGSRYAVSAGNGPRGSAFVPDGNPRATSASLGMTHRF
jgi:predicted porin